MKKKYDQLSELFEIGKKKYEVQSKSQQISIDKLEKEIFLMKKESEIIE
jgi:hypothetical protein